MGLAPLCLRSRSSLQHDASVSAKQVVLASSNDGEVLPVNLLTFLRGTRCKQDTMLVEAGSVCEGTWWELGSLTEATNVYDVSPNSFAHARMRLSLGETTAAVPRLPGSPHICSH